jgi:hypothetical protein
MKARLPLPQRSVDGINCPFPIVQLRVRDRYGTLAELDFRIDPQADLTSIPVGKRGGEGIPFSEERERTVFGLVGETAAYRVPPGSDTRHSVTPGTARPMLLLWPVVEVVNRDDIPAVGQGGC